MDIHILIETAKKAREHAYTPYSNYKVGCALLTKSGKIFSGCNIENDGIMSISEGEKDFKCILVLGGKEELQYTSPCGYCRQFMSEFCDKNFEIYMYYDNDKIDKKTLAELLPDSFNL